MERTKLWLTRAFLACNVLLLLFGQTAAVASADSLCAKGWSQIDCDAILNGWTSWVPDPPCTDNGTDTVTIVGSDHIDKAMKLFTSQGLGVKQAAAIVGNMMRESGQLLNPTATNPTSGAYGIAQWLGGRLDALKKLPSYDTFDVQLSYLWTTDIPAQESQFHGLRDIKQDTDLGDMVYDWEKAFERAGETRDSEAMKQRITNATAVLAKYASLLPGDSNNTSTTVASCGVRAGQSPFCNGQQLPAGTGKFSTSDLVLPNVGTMIARACQITDKTSALFKQICTAAIAIAGGPNCTNACLFVVQEVWQIHHAYGNAYNAWAALPKHPDRNPPVGALLFYDATVAGLGRTGHAAIYLGNNVVMSTDVLGPGGYVYITSASEIENGAKGSPPGHWGLPYLGWADPRDVK